MINRVQRISGLGMGVFAAGIGIGVGTAWAQPTFDEVTLGSLFSYIRDMDVADLDADGDLDVIVSDKSSSTQRWLENDGGTPPVFTERTYSTDGTQYYVEVGDVNGDGNPDILAAQPGSKDRVVWHESDGATPPGFTVHEIGAGGDEAYCVALGDLDGDGDLDALGHYNEPQLVEWYENSGGPAPTWTPHTLDADSGNLRSLQTADIDGDGDLDVMFSGWNAIGPAPSEDDGIGWYQNMGGDPPVFVKKTIGIPPLFQGTYFDTEMVDLDGDGDLDALTALYSAALVGYFANSGGPNPTWTLESIGDAGSGCFDVAAADLDGDGDLDVTATSQTDDTVTWFENTTASKALTWEARVITTTLDRPELVGVGDVTNDGNMDIVAGWIAAPRIVSYYENTPAPTCAGDVDSDGDTDVFDFADLASNFGAGPAATRAMGDLTGDGNVDVFDFAELAGDFGCDAGGV